MGILSLIPVIGEIIDKVIPDPQKKMELNLELAKLADAESARENSLALGQIATNEAEANHRSLFVAGWRPAIGWICGGALLYSTIIGPVFHLQIPDLGLLQTVLMGMLGLGAMRSYDKAKGTANDILPILKPKVTTIVTQTLQPPKKKKGLDLWPF